MQSRPRSVDFAAYGQKARLHLDDEHSVGGSDCAIDLSTADMEVREDDEWEFPSVEPPDGGSQEFRLGVLIDGGSDVGAAERRVRCHESKDIRSGERESRVPFDYSQFQTPRGNAAHA